MHAKKEFLMIFHSKSANKADTELHTGYKMALPLAQYHTMRLQVCLTKALLVFCASLGTVGCIVSAFSLEINMPLIAICLFLFSMLLAFLHYNHTFFNLVYPVIFFVFSYAILKYRVYVNSGFQGIMNVIREKYRDYFVLSYSRQTSEAISNRYLTMTIAFVFLGFFLALMINIAISNYMSTFFTIVMTFPFLQFGLYIGALPGPLYLFLLLFCYVATALLKRSGHFMLSENRRKDKPYTLKKSVHSYKGNGVLMLQLCGVCFAICLFLTGLTYPIMQSHFLETDEVSKPKEVTDHYIKLLVQNGFYSFFNRYQATGGMSDGRLGGISSVSSDQETDLAVTFVPTSTDTVYLKGFTGERYTQDAWLSPDYDETELREQLGADAFYRYTMFSSQIEANRVAQFRSIRPDIALQGKMMIEKKDIRDNHIYVPYFTQNSEQLPVAIDHSVRNKQSDLTTTYSLSYFPLVKDYLGMTSPYYKQIVAIKAANAEEYDYENYFDMYQKVYYKTVPQSCKKALKTATDSIGSAESIPELVEKIQAYFSANYHYSLSPGATPPDQDFVSYFLEEQGEGFCVHFASAGTMLLRAYGIPARYCEGYVIKLSNLADATLLDTEDVTDWLSGTPRMQNSGVVTVELPDANAHAWTEVYLEGFGWYPVDFTPPSLSADEAEENESIFASLFSGMFDGGQPGDGISKNTGDAAGAINESNLFLLIPTAFVLLLMLAIVLTVQFARRYKRYMAMKKACRAGNYNPLVSYQYARTLKALIRKKVPVSKQTLPSDVFEVLSSLLPSMQEELVQAYDILERALYGKAFTSKEKADLFVKQTNKACKQLKRNSMKN